MKVHLGRKDLLIYIFLFLIGIFSRFPLIENYQSHWDGPQYSIALVNYSFAQETPAPPGYPLYLELGKVINLFLNDPHESLLLISVLFSGFGACIFYLFAKSVFSKTTGLISASYFLTASTYYYFGLTAYAYIIVPVMITLLALVVYKIIFKKINSGIALGCTYSILLGFRPQELLFTLPLFLFGFYFLPNIERLKTVLSFAITTLIWFIPFLYLAHGVETIYSMSVSFGRSALPPWSFEILIKHTKLMIEGIYLTFGISIIFMVYYLYLLSSIKLTKYMDNRKIITFFSLWIIPSLLFNLLLRTEHAGYQMHYISVFIFLTSFAIYKMTLKRGILVWLVVVLITTMNLFIFFQNRDPIFVKPYRPTSFHYTDIRKNDLKIGSKIAYIKQNYQPANTLIITTPALWRPYMYHLPEYKIIVLDAIMTRNKRFVHIRRDAENWRRVESIEKQHEFLIPNDVTQIIVIDDDARNWVNVKDKQIISLKGNTYLTLVSAHPGESYKYDYESLEKK